MATTAEIEKLAYELWEKDGRPHGRDEEYYFTAERLLAQRGGNVAVAEAPAKKRVAATGDSPAKPKAPSARSKKQA